MPCGKEISIVTHLRDNARMSLTRLSRKTGIPVSTIFDKLRTTKLIQRHTCLLDFAKLGYNARTKISLKVDRDSREALQDFLRKHEAVNSLYKVNNGYDFMLEGIFMNIKEAEEFVELLEQRFKIIEHKSHFIIEDVKREGFMSDVALASHN